MSRRSWSSFARSALFAFVFVGFAFPGVAHALTAFGPETFAGTGTSKLYTRIFPSPNSHIDYFLRVTTGAAPDGTTTGLSATITLNGKLIFGPGSLKQGRVSMLEKTVKLQAANTLRLLLKGPVGSQVTLIIMGVNTGGDTTPPTITAGVSPAPNGAGWHNSNVTVTFTCSDTGSGIATCPSPVTVTTEGANQVISGTATDKAGNSASASVTLNIDKGQPSITAAISPLPNGAGWNKSDATVTFTCGDTLSGIASCPAPATVTTEGANQLLSGTATDAAGNSASTSVTVNLDKTPPTATITAPQDGAQLTTSPVTVAATVGDLLSGIASVTCNGTAATLSNGTATCQVTLSAGQNSITVQATDAAGNTGSSNITVTLLPPDQPPVSKPGGPYSGMAGSATAFDGSGSTDPDYDPLTFAWDFGDGGTGTGATPSHTYSTAGSFTVSLTVDDGRGGTNQATTTATISSGSVGNLPPDPSTVAPPLARTTATSLLSATQFLYTGTNPIQTGVTPGTITLKQAAIVRGKVLDLTGQPLSGVTMTVLNHPEFGQTLSRADGMFDLAVNGGGLLTVQYHKAGYPSAQRQLTVPWQDFALVPDVVLVPYDAQANPIDLSQICDVNMVCTSHPMQVARGGVVTDADGARRATLLVPTGTTAVMTLADGSAAPLTSLTIRATEYTVGPNGPKAMPAQLPPTSGYTYEVEFSVDEADGAGATRVTFSQPLISYTENFLNFPVGTIVPSGEYDRRKGVWLAEPNGLVIKILSITNGQADLDLTGGGQAATPTALTALGIGVEELQHLASLYPVGQTLWRVPIDHFLGLQ